MNSFNTSVTKDHYRTVQLRFADTKKYKQKWVEKGVNLADYPLTAVFGRWEHEPYLN